MSCFMCSEKMIQTIVNHVRRHILDRAFYAGQEYCNSDLITMLNNENAKSVNYRYPSYEQEPMAEQMEFRPELAVEITPIQFLKLLHCYAYQAGEHPEWKDSLVRRFIGRWEEQAIKNIPGYEEADWSI